MGKTGIIIQARMGSTRLPNKIMLKLADKPILLHVYERCKQSNVDEVIVATTTNKIDDAIENFCIKEKIPFFRGSEEDVLDRYYQCAKKFGLDVIGRVTSDCPLISSEVINEAIKKFNETKADYLTNIALRSFPRGVDVEVFTFEALEKTHSLAKEKHQREHVTPFIYHNPSMFRIENLIAERQLANLKRPEIRLCIDTKEDYELLTIIFDKLFHENKIKLDEVIDFLNDNPLLIEMNQKSEKEHLERSKVLNQKFM